MWPSSVEGVAPKGQDPEVYNSTKSMTRAERVKVKGSKHLQQQ
jgi:hypothetical protein